MIDFELWDIDKEIIKVVGKEDFTKVSLQEFFYKVNKLPPKNKHELFFALRIVFDE